ncbi:iron-containing redox enzyme family protein [Nocardioides caeni]|uniref:Iron-containing redox enzyme family protein n=1 Tax=Nocardioides caeni TaxID=574700 RepID=A0A4V6T624_9ACTN|nr:iron-containing redox enzyme family protein [Nocardioides caeni]THV18306.1 iron-containing redox enzyme family protein [Nocardioides caeni]
MKLPRPRGKLSEALVADLTGGRALDHAGDPDGPDDLHLSLWMLYELHYRGFEDVDDRREWDPRLLAVRAELETSFEDGLREDVGEVLAAADEAEDLVSQLAAIASHEGEASVSQFLHRRATAAQYREFLIERSLYHLKESDPHAWAVPRLDGAAKVALAELQYDEFGGGRPDRLHSALFARALEEAGLDASYGAYVDRVSWHTLAVNNAMSLFGLHRRFRGSAMGHLAAFEMTSPLACRRYLQGAQRLEMGAAVEHYFDEHIEADAVHEEIAARTICGSLAETEPELVDDILFGAAACVHLDEVVARHAIDAWTAGGSVLLGGDTSEVA